MTNRADVTVENSPGLPVVSLVTTLRVTLATIRLLLFLTGFCSFVCCTVISRLLVLAFFANYSLRTLQASVFNFLPAPRHINNAQELHRVHASHGILYVQNGYCGEKSTSRRGETTRFLIQNNWATIRSLTNNASAIEISGEFTNPGWPRLPTCTYENLPLSSRYVARGYRETPTPANLYPEPAKPTVPMGDLFHSFEFICH